MNGLTMAFIRWSGFRSSWDKMPDKPILIKQLTYTEPEGWRQIFQCALRASMMQVRAPLSSSEDAQDIAQSAVLLLLRKVSESGLPASIQSDEQLRRYIVAVVRNLSINRFRSSARRYYVSRESEAIDAASEESLEDQFSDIEQLELLNKAIPQLPAAYRQILLLRYFKELSLAEIAEILGVSEANAKTKLYRAVHRLRQLALATAGKKS